MFPELAKHFQAVYDAAPEGTLYVLPRFHNAGANLRTQFVRYIEAAGLKPWPKPWQNLRASRATELADQFPSHVCAAWLGHTEAIADEFYRQVTDEHFTRAVSAAQNPAQYPAESRGKGSQAADEESAESTELQLITDDYCLLHNDLMGDEGFEPPTSAV